MRRLRCWLVVAALPVLLTACVGRMIKPPPPAGAASAPALGGFTALVFPVQDGVIPSADSTARHWPAERATIDAEIAYWLPQGAPRTHWVLPEAMDKALARSPGLDVDLRNLAVGVFQHAQVKRIGDPLFGDIRKLAAVLNANLAVVPIGAEYVGATRESAKLQIAVAVIKMDADVAWFGVIEGADSGVAAPAATASAAQAFARAFAEKKKPGDS